MISYIQILASDGAMSLNARSSFIISSAVYTGETIFTCRTSEKDHNHAIDGRDIA